MQIIKTLFRTSAILIAAAAIFFLAILNVRLYQPGRVDTAISQLRFLKQSLSEGGAERMQLFFPEGYLFTLALYGLTSANVARSLPPSDPRRNEALRAAREAITHVNSDTAKATFVAEMTPRHGAFYASWSLYVRSAVLRASLPTDPVPFDLRQFEQDCDNFALALAASDSPFLDSFPEAVWPVDTSVGIAALAIANPYLGNRHKATVATWISRARLRRDLQTGALSHNATADGLSQGSPRGGSLAMMSFVLADADPAFARQQYDVLRKYFVDYSWGIPAVREYPHGVNGITDVDSGPVILGFSGPASVLGAGAAIAHGDASLATTLLATIEFVGMPVEWGGSRQYAGGYVPVGDAFLAWARSGPPVAGAKYDDIVPPGWRLLIHAVSLLLAGAIAYATSMLVASRLRPALGRSECRLRPFPTYNPSGPDLDVQRVAQCAQGRFLDRFTERRVCVDGATDILQPCAHLDRLRKRRA